MSKKRKEGEGTLPQTFGTETEQTSSITYANDVVAIIAGLAASEVEGVAGMCSVNGSLLGKNKSMTRGVKVEVGTEEASIDLYMIVEYGTPIQRAAHDAQESVKKSIESMTGLHVVRVDVHVLGVSFEKEMSALQAGAGKAVLEAGDTPTFFASHKEDPEEDPEEEPEEEASDGTSKKELDHGVEEDEAEITESEEEVQPED